MSESLVLVAQDHPAITTLTFNRAEKRNALSIGLMTQLCAALETANADANTRVIVLRGAGPVFCAGLDMSDASPAPRAEASAHLAARLMETVYLSPKVTIAAVQGAALSIGAGLVMCCDVAVAARETLVGFPEVRHGLVAGLVLAFLRRQLRERDARELLILGELVGAERALAMGLLNRVVSAEGLEVEVQTIAAQALQGAPGAITRSKEFLDAIWPQRIRDDLKRAFEYHRTARETEEAREGVSAFMEKRPPRWQV